MENTLGQIGSIITKPYHSNFNTPALKNLSHKFKEMWTLCEQKIANYIQLKSHVSLDVGFFRCGPSKYGSICWSFSCRSWKDSSRVFLPLSAETSPSRQHQYTATIILVLNTDTEWIHTTPVLCVPCSTNFYFVSSKVFQICFSVPPLPFCWT